MAKRKAGLHKKISSIFDGVRIPEDDAEPACGGTGAPPGEEAGCVVPAQPAVEPARRGEASEPVVEAAEPNQEVGKSMSEGGEPTGANVAASDSVESLAEPSESMPEASESVLEAARRGGEPEEQVSEEVVVAPKPAEIPTMRREPVPRASVARVSEAEIGMKVAEEATLLQAFQRIKDKLFAPKEGAISGRQKTMAMLVPILSIALFIALGRVLMKPSGRAAPPPAVQPTNVQPAAASTEINWELPEPYPTTLRDPMQAASVAVGPHETNHKLDIRGIVYSEDNPSAVIGTEIVHEGDEVSGAIVVKINRSSVEFEKDGKRWTEKVQH